MERLGEAECLRLIEPGGIGRIAFTGRYGVTVLPVNYRMREGAVVFRTGQGSATEEDLRTGIADAGFKVGFEIDRLVKTRREGWSVLIQGAAHRVDPEDERAAVPKADVRPWPGGEEAFLRIVPTRITG
ncbi:pyridoxamine 5'-phosphate oxidase family protein [Actinomadura kijaniata]|uniref:pyridoxamine 5'-phosphate oxidase family protein n=1 Tax=Actinomadura kijaniata TaxID=46161 RepID=UPI001470E609|nr:pyridoxamine 5'-phosphate oxidase family protein [Actinomadura kijaniata]